MYLCMFVIYVYMDVCMYVCKYVCMIEDEIDKDESRSADFFDRVRMTSFICMYVCMYVTYVCMHVCMYAFMYVCFARSSHDAGLTMVGLQVYAPEFPEVGDIYIYVCIYIYTHTYTHI